MGDNIGSDSLVGTIKTTRQLGPLQKKLQIVNDLFQLALKVKMHRLCRDYPQLSEKELKIKAIELLNNQLDD